MVITSVVIKRLRPGFPLSNERDIWNAFALRALRFHLTPRCFT